MTELKFRSRKKKQANPKRRKEKGAALPLVAGILATLLGLSAFAVDLGWIYLNTSRLQRAADAAALAGVVHLPAFPTRVTDDATAAATANGFEPDTGPNGPLSWRALDDNRLEVTLTTNVEPFFLRALGFNQFTVSRRATAEYIKPVPIGSPFSSFGDGTDSSQNFWASISGQYTSKVNGDAFNSRCDWSPSLGECVDSDPSNTSRWSSFTVYPGDIDADSNPNNPTYQRGGGTEGYYFGIDKTTSGSTTIVLIDPWFQRRQNSSGSCAQQKATGDCDRLVWGPSPGSSATNTNGPNTTFTLYAPDSTPLDPYDNSTVVCTDTYNQRTPTESSTIQEATLCSITGQGLYVLRVTTDGGHGSNQFGIKTTGQPAKVYGINDISIYANANNATLYLAEILPVHAGKKLILEFFDPGEGQANATMTIRPAPRPNGSANTGVTCEWIAEDTDGNQMKSGSSCQLETTLGGVAQFNNYWVRVTVDIPSTYNCNPNAANPANGCWWRMDMNLNTPHDRTTWTARVVGNPIRLVANE